MRCHGHLALHSFPTRRSSDLMVQEIFLRLWEHPDRFDQTRGSLRSFLLRSEEHTSELQSPYELVCGLVLEKKKFHTDEHKIATQHGYRFVEDDRKSGLTAFVE